MTVVVDTNTLVQMMGRASPFAALKQALEQGQLVWAVSTSVLPEYEEVVCRHAGGRASGYKPQPVTPAEFIRRFLVNAT